ILQVAERPDAGALERGAEIRRGVEAAGEPHLEAVRTELPLDARQHIAEEEVEPVLRRSPAQMADQEDARELVRGETVALGTPLRADAVPHRRVQVEAARSALASQPLGVMAGEVGRGRALVQQLDLEARQPAEHRLHEGEAADRAAGRAAQRAPELE